jgi:hypothetical protein
MSITPATLPAQNVVNDPKIVSILYSNNLIPSEVPYREDTDANMVATSSMTPHAAQGNVPGEPPPPPPPPLMQVSSHQLNSGIDHGNDRGHEHGRRRKHVASRLRAIFARGSSAHDGASSTAKSSSESSSVTSSPESSQPSTPGAMLGSQLTSTSTREWPERPPDRSTGAIPKATKGVVNTLRPETIGRVVRCAAT